MTKRAGGTFDVKVVALGPGQGEGLVLGRMSLDKKFHGEIEGTGTGEMLTGMTAVKGSAAYVAMEQVSGTVQGRRGTFLLQHTGTMRNGESQMTVRVVPDSGTGQLVGLAGELLIKIAPDGTHSYELVYTLGETP
jgi:hypothetical protein